MDEMIDIGLDLREYSALINTKQIKWRLVAFQCNVLCNW